MVSEVVHPAYFKCFTIWFEVNPQGQNGAKYIKAVESELTG